MIVIATTPGRELWLKDCLESLNRPCLILSDFTYELGKIRWCAHNLKEKFLFLQDSVIIKSHDWIDEVLEFPGSTALTDDPRVYGMYMGVYEPDLLLQTSLPQVHNKAEAIRYEIDWTCEYAGISNPRVLWSDLKDAKHNGEVTRHGKLCRILENDFIIKYKSNWGQISALD